MQPLLTDPTAGRRWDRLDKEEHLRFDLVVKLNKPKPMSRPLKISIGVAVRAMIIVSSDQLRISLFMSPAEVCCWKVVSDCGS